MKASVSGECIRLSSSGLCSPTQAASGSLTDLVRSGGMSGDTSLPEPGGLVYSDESVKHNECNGRDVLSPLTVEMEVRFGLSHPERVSTGG